MANEPDIIKKLKEEEKLGLFEGKAQGVSEEIDFSKESLDDASDKMVSFVENEDFDEKSASQLTYDMLEFRPQWQFENKKLGSYYRSGVIHRKLFFSALGGDIHVEDAENAIPSLEQVFREGVLTDSEYIRIADYSDVKKASVNGRKCYASAIARLNREYNARPVITYICGASPIIKTSLRLFARLVKQKFIFVSSVDQAFEQLNSNKKGAEAWRNGKKTVIQKDVQKDIDAITAMYGDLLWDEKTAPVEDSLSVSSDSPLYQLAESLVVVRNDLQHLRQQNREKTQKLEESGERYRKLVEDIHKQTQIWEVDANGVYTYISPSTHWVYGLEPEDVIGKTPFDFMPPGEAKRIAEVFKKIVGSSEPFFNLENIAQHKDGHQLIMETSGSPYFADDGTFLGYRGTAYDITDRKKAEKMLREGKERFENLFENMSNGVAVYEAVDDGNDFVFRDLNKAGERIERVKREDVIGKRVTEAFPGVKDFGLFEVFQRVWRTGKPERHPVSLYKDDRLMGWRENYVYKLHSGEIVAMYDDVTERKKSEELLKTHTKWLETLNGIITSGSRSKDLKSLLEDVLNSILNLMDFGGGGIYLVDETTRTAELREHKGLPDDFIKNTKQEKIDESPYDTIFIKGQPIFTENYSEIQPERSEKWGFLSVASLPLFAKDKIIGALNVASKTRHSFSDEEKDIFRAIGREAGTAISKMRMEKTLQDSEERYKTLVELSPDVIVVHIKGKIAFINSAGVNLIGAENLEQLLGKSIIDFIHPDYREKVMERLKEQKEGKKILPIEEKLLRLDGTEIDVEAISTLVVYQGKPAVQVVIRDITERKRVEAEINYLKKYNENILESNPNPIIVIKENQIEYVNKSFVSVFGKTKDNYISKDLKDAVPTKTISTCEEILKNHKKTTELEIKDNIFSVSSFIVKKAEAEEEEEERIGLILQDITERKKAEKELEGKIDELERWKKVTVGRELKMIELKDKIKRT